MPLDPISAADSPPTTRKKVNAGLAATDRNTDAVAQIGEAVADLQERAGQDELNRSDADADLMALAALASVSGLQPGTAPAAFGGSTLGAIGNINPLDPAQAFLGSFGPALRMAGSGIVAPRASVLFDPDAILILEARYWRVTDVLDPNNNAVDLGIQWLDSQGGDLGTTLLSRESNLRLQDGLRTRTFRVPSLSGKAPAITAPPGTISWRPFLRTYGSDGVTAVGTLGVRDATFAGVYAPDVVALAARLRTLEGQIAAGLPVSTPILPSYAITDLPRAGNRGRKAFVLNGRAPNAAGALEAANAGTGVEVTDNGTAWVITGTNQQVQA